VAEHGFLMVNLWWIRGESWLVGGRFLGSAAFGFKDAPPISDLSSRIRIRESFGDQIRGAPGSVELH
jgi:hypothetical protein